MKLTKVNFNRLKNNLDNLIIISRDEVILYDAGEFPDLHPTWGYFPVLVTEFDNKPLAKFKDNFNTVREEMKLNVSIVENTAELTSYLNDIIEYYSLIDSYIIEDKQGNLSCDIFKLQKITKNIYYDQGHLTFHEFLEELKVILRNEHKWIKETFFINATPNDFTSEAAFTGFDMKWRRNINDLVELVRALKLSGSINNSTNNLTLDEAYKFFGDLFGIEIKRPEDQLRQKAESMKKLFFLEELNEIFQKDMKELMKRRMQ